MWAPKGARWCRGVCVGQRSRVPSRACGAEMLQSGLGASGILSEAAIHAGAFRGLLLSGLHSGFLHGSCIKDLSLPFSLCVLLCKTSCCYPGAVGRLLHGSEGRCSVSAPQQLGLLGPPPFSQRQVPRVLSFWFSSPAHFRPSLHQKGPAHCVGYTWPWKDGVKECEDE